MDNASVSVVIPVYNSYYSIEEVVCRTIKSLDKINVDYEIILVDDFSKDDSLRKLNELEERFNVINVISLNDNLGQQTAIKIGMGIAKGDLIVTMDDDLEHQPEDLILLINEMYKGYDVVYGVYNNENYPLYRKLGSKLVDLFFTLGLDKPKKIRVGSYRIINRKILDEIVMDDTPFVYISAIILRITKNIGNVYVNHRDRKYGNSNYNLIKLLKLFMNLFYYYKIAGKFSVQSRNPASDINHNRRA
jgi:undecaprenyl-phosphate 4-deoxy-4-formamido-L-arabinose transferase